MIPNPSLLLLLLAWLLHHSTAQPSDPAYTLAWSEEFDYPDGQQPSAAAWSWDQGGGGWGTGELECYTAFPNNSAVLNGSLVITAQPGPSAECPFTSARLTTAAKVQFYLGFVAARARINMRDGFWPAMWALGSATASWPSCGEVDFMEQANALDSSQYGTLHWNLGGQDADVYDPQQLGAAATSANGSWGADWHVYAFEWTAHSIAFSVDGAVYFAVNTSAQAGMDSFSNASNPFYLLVDLALGGSFPGVSPEASALPGSLWVDWVRVYQRGNDGSYVSVAGGGGAGSSSSPDVWPWIIAGIVLAGVCVLSVLGWLCSLCCEMNTRGCISGSDYA